MRDENTLMISGRLVRDPDFQRQSADKCKIKIGLAVHVDDEKTYFFTVIGYDKLAEFANENFKKGDPVILRGYIRQFRFKDDTSGKENIYIDIVAQRISLLGKHKRGEKKEFNLIDLES